jgi:hypothetical protein
MSLICRFHVSHGFTKSCSCTGSCPASSTTGGCAVNEYAIAKAGGGAICVKFGSGLIVEGNSATNLVDITDDLLTVTIDNTPVIYTQGAAATSDNGNKLHALLLIQSSTRGVFYSECGPFIVESDPTDGDGRRKRVPEVEFLTVGSGVFVTSVTVSGDPHLAGAHGIKFDVYGKPAANYSLVVAPAFEINMQLANNGPEMRFMTAMAVLYQGKSFVITPWTVKTNSAELIGAL